MQIILDWVGAGGKRWRGRVLNVSDTRGVIFAAKCGTFLSDVFTIPPGAKIRGATLFTTSKSVTLITVITDGVPCQVKTVNFHSSFGSNDSVNSCVCGK